MVRQLDRTLYFSIYLKILGTTDLAFDLH
jgi:hypothetical protein